jgi:hypothetical protein
MTLRLSTDTAQHQRRVAVQRVLIGMAAACVIAMQGCSTPLVTNSAVAAAGTALAGHLPTSNIMQTYYLGVFDPQEQVPSTIYRVRVQGQASALSATKFASGWVPANVVDSLSGRITPDGVGHDGVDADKKERDALRAHLAKSALDRRLVMFGPEGFREAPRNHRLVVVMGSNPEGFFNAVDRALGVVAGATQASPVGPDVLRTVWEEVVRVREERRSLQTMIDMATKE